MPKPVKKTRFRHAVLVVIGALIAVGLAVIFLKTDWHERTIKVNGASRRYLWYAPEKASGKRPLLLAFHGFSGTADGMRKSSKLHELVDANQFYLAYMDGNPTWHRPVPDRPGPDVEFFDALCEELQRKYPIDSSRIYVTGMSMGGEFAIRLASIRSQRIAAVASQGMVTDGAVEAERPFPLLIIVGTEDDRVPPNFFPRVPNAFQERGHEVKVIRPDGVGHRWHVPLNGELWSFLSNHSLEQRPPTHAR
ncbi:MAG: dienelactone hydrolase family protein [Pirellulaceae bacterium]|nr:dienelactone hydrolase family protein [Planctomycetales bacterium]